MMWRGSTTAVLAAALAVLAAPAVAATPIVIAWTAAGAPEDVARGVQMGVEEGRQTAALLQRDVRVEAAAPHPFASIRAEGGQVTIAGPANCTFRLLPADAERAALLAAWRKEHASPGDMAIAAWHPSLVRYGAGELNERFTRAFHEPMTEGAWAGWAAVKAIVEAALRATAANPCGDLAALRFDAHKGALLTFQRGDLRQPLYVIDRTPAGGRVVAELPPS